MMLSSVFGLPVSQTCSRARFSCLTSSSTPTTSQCLQQRWTGSRSSIDRRCLAALDLLARGFFTTCVVCKPRPQSYGRSSSTGGGGAPTTRGYPNKSRVSRTHSSGNKSHDDAARPLSSPQSNSSPRGFSEHTQAQLQQHSEHYGIFQSQHVKPFPVRAAIDIGTGGAISLCIGRVDARVGAVRKLMYQTQLPLYLEKLQQCKSDTNTHQDRHHQHHNQSSRDTPAAEGEDGVGGPGTFTLSERTVDDIRNKMRVLHGAMRRNAFEGLSERAAVLSWPLCCATNAQRLADELTREFQVDVRVLGTTFHVEWPPSVSAFSNSSTMNFSSSSSSTAVLGEAGVSSSAKHREKTASAPNELSPASSGKKDKLKTLLRSSASIAATQKQHRPPRRGDGDATAAHPSHVDASAHFTHLSAQVDTLAFLAHAAVSQCIAPQRLLVLSEDPQRGVRVLGLNTSAAVEVSDLLEGADSADAVAKLKSIAFGDEKPGGASSLSTAPQGNGSFPFERKTAAALPYMSPASGSMVPVDAPHKGLGLIEHTFPVDVATAHRYCITHVQRRPAESYGLHTSSPNPLLADEFTALRNMLAEGIAHDLPRWVRRKSQLGGMLVATSHNGGLFNTAARVAQQTQLSLDHLEVHAQHHFCGLTDVLLAENFPNPLMVLPAAALTAALLRALSSPRMTYVPELSVAAALLVQPSLWLASRSAEVRQRLSRDPFYAAHTSAQRGRVFERPHRKDNPTAAPDATWVQGEKWNALSYEQSMKGM